MTDLAHLLSAFLWPVIILILAGILNRQIRRLFNILLSRIERGDDVSFGNFISLSQTADRLEAPTVTSGNTGELDQAEAGGVSNPDYGQFVRAAGLKGNCSTLLIATAERLSAKSSGIGVGDAMAMAEILATTVNASMVHTKTIVIRGSFGRAQMLYVSNPNIISIGGSALRRLSPIMFAVSDPKLELHSLSVFDARTRKAYMPRIDQFSLSGFDYALIISGPNPLEDGGRVIMVAGCNGFGTHGAAWVLSHPSNFLDEFKKRRIDPSKPYETLLRVPIKNGMISRERDTTKMVVARAIP